MNKETKHRLYIVILIGVAWLLYLVTLLINDGRQYYDVSLSLDNYIPFLPVFIIPYMIWWPLVWLPVFLAIKDRTLLIKVGLAFVSLIVISNILFLAFPTKIERPYLDKGNIFEELVGIFYSLDYPYNLFPSLHISSSILSYLILFSLRKSLAYKLSVVYLFVLLSPLFVKQHYLLDVFAGLLLGLIIYYTFFINKRVSNIFSAWFKQQ